MEDVINFFFGIELKEDDEGNRRWDVNWYNTGVPTERIIMDMKAFMERHERAYFTNFPDNN